MTSRGLQPPSFESSKIVQSDHDFSDQDLLSDESIESGDFTARADAAENEVSPLSVCLVGPGWRFTSGISYYTCRLANSLAGDRFDTSVVLIQRLLQRVLTRESTALAEAFEHGISPGHHRLRRHRLVVGHFPAARPALSRPRAPRYCCLSGGPPPPCTRTCCSRSPARPRHWSSSRCTSCRTPARPPSRSPGATATLGLRALLRLAHGCIVHSKSDWQLFEANYGPMDVRMALAPHGPYDQYGDVTEIPDPAMAPPISR